jgi:hypothetical protein
VANAKWCNSLAGCGGGVTHSINDPSLAKPPTSFLAGVLCGTVEEAAAAAVSAVAAAEAVVATAAAAAATAATPTAPFAGSR